MFPQLGKPALVLAPMEGVTDSPMRTLMGEIGAFTYCVSEFLRVSAVAPPANFFLKHMPELKSGSRTPSGLPVQVQLLGGNPERLAEAARTAIRIGALAIDLNFGCPAPTVNRHDGGATLLKFPARIREIVSVVRSAIPVHIPVSAKLRLGWDDINSIHQNADCAAEGGATWITIHARTKKQGYAPPVYWKPIGEVRERLSIPVVANGDIWTREDFLRCQEETECEHFMLGRGALARPNLSVVIAKELGLPVKGEFLETWPALLRRLAILCEQDTGHGLYSLGRLKQWTKLAHAQNEFPAFERVKMANSLAEFFEILSL